MENENKLKNKSAQTYTGDMVKAIGIDKSGLVKRIIHEEEEHEALKKNLSPSSKKNRVFMFISIVFIALAFVVLIFLAFSNKNTYIIPTAPQVSSIIFTDQTDFKEIGGFTNDQIIETISNQINNTAVKIGGIERIYLTENKKIIGFERFITLIKSSLTVNQTSFIDDNFLMGVLNTGIKPTSTEGQLIPAVSGSTLSVGKDFFMLLKVRSFTEIFPIMRNWENKMLYDLHGFFGVNMTPETDYLFTKNFEDTIIANKNARILKDKDGQIVLMYIFVDNTTIIITNSEAATGEVILRLASSQIKK